MTYLSWAALYEGSTDRVYFEVLIPRVMEELTLLHGIQNVTIPANPALTISRGTIKKVAKEACEAKQAFHLVFIHADTGGRNLETAMDGRSCAYCREMNKQCSLSPARCVLVSPRHETEAWVLADGNAVTLALGYSGAPATLGLPNGAREAERLTNPKQVLESAGRTVRGRNRPFDPHRIHAAIAQRQSLERLREARSFRSFETALCRALADLGCVNAPL